MEATLREVQAHLAEYVARAKAGEELTITDNGLPVARLMPLPKTLEQLEREAIARLDAQSWIRPPVKDGKVNGGEPPIPWNPGEKTLSDLVLEDRP